MKLANKCIAVTGCGEGIGKGIAISLAKHGATVYGCSRTQSKLDVLKSECPLIVTTALDVTDWDLVEKWINEIPALDGLVNNAGITIGGDCWNTTRQAISTMIDLNVTAPIHLIQVFAKKLIAEKRPGNIINISSVISKKAETQRFVYSATKAAVDQMTRSAAFELGPYNIRVNAVSPTLVITPMQLRLFTDEAIEERASQIPLRKLPEVEDIANAVAFLLSDDAKMITGQNLAVDGGILTG